ncbi:phosphoribosylaminoimidazolesuccinocarboxamide synthase [Fodinisporobacter ferrooxydans]|uniref:Phosphoribosylaminoimidazole-succinocarboxamide synthase n=1 Tax=Fodinisporobacter ferrooxydans TaxID=2901836 RepID=A0ABY4CS27_9BACL|nr:phosphoribosylaminoimidazolesuccinocarboxamide synthase [Alicyclobacillaceae bacterium MYW30-H2]
MTQQHLLYEGKAKRVYRTEHPDQYIVSYKDDATAFNGEKKATILGKGELNNRISTIFFKLLNGQGIPTHFIERLSDREQLVKKVTIIPLEVVVRNIAAGSLAKRLGMAEGTQLRQAVIEFYYKNDALGDPLVNDSHIALLELATPEQLQQIQGIARKINDILQAYLLEREVVLVDFKLEFGIDTAGSILLADEISPDTCRFWDAKTQEKLDKDRFRRDLGGVEDAYKEILRRLGGEQA